MPRSLVHSAYEVANVTVVDTTAGALNPNMTVEIANGRITAIRPSTSNAEHSERRIEGRGRYLIPGFFDMHAHVLDAGAPQAYLDVMLASGITGFRQMSGSSQLLEKRRDGALSDGGGPRLLAMPGEILTNLNAATPEAAIDQVRRQKALGADFIKVLEVPPPSFFAALAEARGCNIPFVGHLPATVDALEASNAGMRSIEHLGPRDSILAGCTCAGHAAAVLPQLGQKPPALPPGVDPAAYFARMIANPLLFTNPAEFERYRTVVDAFNDIACIDLAETFAENATWQVPTLIRLRTMAYADDACYREAPGLRFVPWQTRKLWDELAEQFSSRLPGATKKAIRDIYALQERLVERFARAGVPLLAGSDLGGQWVLPGIGLHQEFDLLAGAGLSPLRILQMATIDGARFLSIDHEFGSVAEGKCADLLLLDENPLENVAALHGLSGVVRADTYYARQDLEALKDAAATTFRSAE